MDTVLKWLILTVLIQYIFCEDCYVDVGGIPSYSGTTSVTATGRTCQRWDATTPHAPNYPMSSAHVNYCRTPDDDSKLWCYTMDPFKRWEYCNIPKCSSTTTSTTSTTTTTTPSTTTSTTTTPSTTTSTTTPSTTTSTTTPSTTTSTTTTPSTATSTTTTPSTTTSTTTTPSTTTSTTTTPSTTTSTTTPSTTTSTTTTPGTTSSTTTTTPSTTSSTTTTTPSTTSSTTTTTPSTTSSTTTTDSTTSSTTTMAQASVASHSFCWCRCESRESYWWQYYNNNLTNEEKAAILDVEIRRIQNELKIEKKVLSSYVRARTSVQDERTSAESVGYLGIVLLSCIVGLFVLSDCLKLISFLFDKNAH